MLTPSQIIEAVRREPKVPAPPQAVFQVLELTKDPECDIKRVAEVIGRDSGLTAQLFRQANSALYGFSSPTSSVITACVRLGLKRVRTAVINQHVVSGLGQVQPPGFDARRYWQRTFAISVAAHDLCQELLPELAEEAGTAGLLCDIGVGLLAFGIPEIYAHVLSELLRSDDMNLIKIEENLLHVTHAEVGAAVLKDWKLDQHMVDAVRSHHVDSLAPDSNGTAKFSKIVAAAVTLSHIALGGSDMDKVATLFAQVDNMTTDADALVARLLDQLVGNIQSTAEVLSVELGPVDQMHANFDDLVRDMPDFGHHMSFHPMPRASTDL